MNELRALLKTEATSAGALYLHLTEFSFDFLDVWWNLPIYTLSECLWALDIQQDCDDFASFCAMPL